MFTILAILIFIRPFISSLAFPYLDFVYSSILLGFLFFWLITKKGALKEIISLRYPLILFSLALTVSLAFSLNKITSLREIYKYITYILIFLVSVNLADKNKIRIYQVLVLAAAIISILAIYQYFLGFKHILHYMSKQGLADPFTLDYISRKRVFFPFVTPNTLAGYLIIVLPLTLIIKEKLKWFLFFILAFSLLLTKSLGAFFSLFAAVGTCLWLKNDFSKKKILLLLSIGVCTVSIFALRQLATKEYILPSFSFWQRLSYWRDACEIIKAHPFAGVGIGNFNLQASRYAHNSYLQLWAEMGILGLLSFLWLVFFVVKRAYKSEHSAILIISISVFLIHNILDFTFFMPEVSIIWWVILGLGMSGQFAQQTDYKILNHP